MARILYVAGAMKFHGMTNKNFSQAKFGGLIYQSRSKSKSQRKYTLCNEYKLGAKGGSKESGLVHTQDTEGMKPENASFWVPNIKLEKIADKIEICFIASCAENRDTEVSLERWGAIPNTTKEGWNKLQTEGGSGVLGPAAAHRPTDEQDILVLLARYEGLKLATLYSNAAFGRQ